MQAVVRVATWIEVLVVAVAGQVVRGSVAVLVFVLRRGKHRTWRRMAADRSRSDAVRR